MLLICALTQFNGLELRNEPPSARAVSAIKKQIEITKISVPPKQHKRLTIAVFLPLPLKNDRTPFARSLKSGLDIEFWENLVLIWKILS